MKAEVRWCQLVNLVGGEDGGGICKLQTRSLAMNMAAVALDC